MLRIQTRALFFAAVLTISLAATSLLLSYTLFSISTKKETDNDLGDNLSSKNSDLSTQCDSYDDSESFREFIFCNFGFSREAQKRIRETTSIVVPSKNCSCWQPTIRRVSLLDYSKEAAVHELSHAFWEEERLDSNRRLELVKGLIKLASGEGLKAEFPDAYKFAREYIEGIGDWKGMFCSYGNRNCVEGDRYSLSDQEIIQFTSVGRVLDHEIYAGFSSWTMGKLSSGKHRLPEFMAKNFREQFTEEVLAVPYYEGGPKY